MRMCLLPGSSEPIRLESHNNTETLITGAAELACRPHVLVVRPSPFSFLNFARRSYMKPDRNLEEKEVLTRFPSTA